MFNLKAIVNSRNVQKLELIGVVVGVIFFLLSLLASLQFFRFQHLLFDITEGRIEVPAEALKRDIERSIVTGIALNTNAQVPFMLNNVIQSNPIVLAIEIKNPATQELLWSAGKRPASSKLSTESGSFSKRHVPSSDSSSTPVFVQQWPIVDALGLTVAQLTFISDKAEAIGIANKARTQLINLALTLFIASLLVLAPILFLLTLKLDKIVASAKAVMLGNTLDQNTIFTSEVCQLAQNAQDAKNLALAANSALAAFSKTTPT